MGERCGGLGDSVDQGPYPLPNYRALYRRESEFVGRMVGSGPKGRYAMGVPIWNSRIRIVRGDVFAQ